MIKNNITNNFLNGVIHVPDYEKNIYWDKIKKLTKSNTKSNTKYISDELEIITWNNIPEKDYFEKSCKNKGIEIKNYGKEIKNWSNYFKFELNLKAAYETKCKYIMGCDSHDALLIGDPNFILKKFLEKKCFMIFNSEKKFFPDIPEINPQKWKNFQRELLLA